MLFRLETSRRELKKSKNPVSEKEKREKDEATLRMIEQIRKAEVDEAKLQAKVK